MNEQHLEQITAVLARIEAHLGDGRIPPATRKALMADIGKLVDLLAVVALARKPLVPRQGRQL